MAGSGDQAFFRSILENLHTAVYVVGRDGRILFWNDGAERITGYLRQDVIGRVRGDNFLGETDGDEADSNGALTPIASATRDGKPQQGQVSLRTAARKSSKRLADISKTRQARPSWPAAT